MTSTATEGQTPDVYGQVHPIETSEILKEKRSEFEAELEKIPLDDKLAWTQAQAKCPELLTEDFELKFLRCEVFNADLAAKRYVSYWNKRLEIFGPEKAFLPLTLAAGLEGDDVPLELGVMSLLDLPDPSGRSIVCFDPSHLDSSKYTTNAMVRAFWYVLHAALERESTQQRGLLVLVDPQRAYMSQFDSTIGTLFMASMSGVLPLRMSGIHIVYPPYFVNLVLPIVQYFMPERMQKRIRFHSGTQEVVVAKLNEEFGLTPPMLPIEVGGTLKVDHKGWLQTRRDAGL